MSFVITCTEEQCGNGQCMQQCIADCGGVTNDVARFACGDAIGVQCECLAADGGGGGGGVGTIIAIAFGVGAALALGGVVIKWLCAPRAAPGERVRIVRA